ncbi:helix-turn-helix domain-containing protein [Nakamurella sp. YIM 132084]|uniref:Helix-turn-helix domain-containing protein n=2 Tax=Nakamurella leprariae TaxID=2803911 RepID=A0A939BXW5_9ACTN|nr:helix-turn-helix domain-containing protein [Nakamurella leprariae]
MSDDPVTALRAIRLIHVELSRLEAVAVRRARTAGLPWAGIADALGVTRQAVHRKHGGSRFSRD